MSQMSMHGYVSHHQQAWKLWRWMFGLLPLPLTDIIFAKLKSWVFLYIVLLEQNTPHDDTARKRYGRRGPGVGVLGQTQMRLTTYKLVMERDNCWVCLVPFYSPVVTNPNHRVWKSPRIYYSASRNGADYGTIEDPNIWIHFKRIRALVFEIISIEVQCTFCRTFSLHWNYSGCS